MKVFAVTRGVQSGMATITEHFVAKDLETVATFTKGYQDVVQIETVIRDVRILDQKE